jgi:hypothetical protein
MVCEGHQGLGLSCTGRCKPAAAVGLWLIACVVLVVVGDDASSRLAAERDGAGASSSGAGVIIPLGAVIQHADVVVSSAEHNTTQTPARLVRQSVPGASAVRTGDVGASGVVSSGLRPRGEGWAGLLLLLQDSCTCPSHREATPPRTGPASSPSTGPFLSKK